MQTIFWRAFKDRRSLVFVYSVVSILLLLMYVGLFPSIKNQSANLELLIKSYPEAMLKAFNFDISNFTTLEGFISTEQFSFMWPILTITMLVGYAGYSVANEIEKGTIELLLSQPISRIKLFVSRYFAGLFMFLLFIIFSIFSAMPIASMYGISYNPSHFVTIAILATLFGLAIFSIAMFLTTIFSDKGKVFFVSGAFLVIMYVINIVAAIKESLNDLKFASFFYYFNPGKALIYNQIDHWAYLVFLATFLVFFVLGLIFFVNKDIAS